MVCCQILGKYPDEASIPMLILALDDPSERDSLVPAPYGTAEHLYRAVWEEALRALESIGGEAVSSYQDRAQLGSPKEKWIAEAKEWWRKRKELSDKTDAGGGK